MIGTAENAALALTDPRQFVLSDDGSTRSVYLIDGVVYKREHWYGINSTEYDNILNGKADLPEGVSYPEVSLYTIDGTDVIAMEYVKGMAIYECYCEDMGDPCSDMCMTDKERDILIDCLDDPSGRNVIRCDSGYVIIDAA